MSRSKTTYQRRWDATRRVLLWFQARERNALLALLAAAVLLILCSLAGGMSSTPVWAEETAALKERVIPGP